MFKFSSRRNLRVSVVALLVVSFAGILGARALPDASAAGNGRSGKFVPASGAYFGMWNRNGEMTEANVKTQIASREATLGRKLDIDHHFHQFTSTIPTWSTKWDIANGRIPLIAWAAYDTNPINAGLMDNHIRATAQRLKALNSPIFLRWYWEPEWERAGAITNGTANYISAYRRIHNIFEQEAVSNVAFVYCATAWGFVTGEAQTFYPGDDYVDWVCSDGYNWAPQKVGAQWASFDKVFRQTHDFAVAHNKPMMAAEVGVQEGTVGQKSQWFADAATAMKTTYPNLAAFVYFDEDRRPLGGYDWRLDSSAASLNAWANIGRDPYFNPGSPPTPTTAPATTAAPTTTTAAPTTTTAPPTTTTTAPITTTTPPPVVTPLFSDGFESGNFARWHAAKKATISSTQKHAGAYGAVLSTTNGGSYLTGLLMSSRSSLTVNFQVKVIDDPNVTTPLLRLVGDSNTGLISLALTPDGELVLRNPRTGTIVKTGVKLPMGAWHQVKFEVNTSTGTTSLFLDGSLAETVTGSAWRGSPVNRFDLGDIGGQRQAKAYSFAYDAVRAD